MWIIWFTDTHTQIVEGPLIPMLVRSTLISGRYVAEFLAFAIKRKVQKTDQTNEYLAGEQGGYDNNSKHSNGDIQSLKAC
ncbi:hypothetical protein XH91_27625 [Bradyrhizobium guangzhouense]|uniref:Uncharacterized protein n=1 Tax=Bradyrhizobium guangzhouense TaxID=1325095 RepID=A0AAE5X4T0_9BRAD|nr:hypothetical protein XH91_27625 [Bradyrhizobium guangzhouense]